MLCPRSVAHASPPVDSVYFRLPFDYEQWRRDHPRPVGKRLADLNRGEPRTVRTILFSPNDRPFRTGLVDSIKTAIKQSQAFFGEQMEAHGYGYMTFRFETDAQGEPLVHRVDGQHPESHYDWGEVSVAQHGYPHTREIEQVFDLEENIYVIYRDFSKDTGSATGYRLTKKRGEADLPPWGANWATLSHELAHAFGLDHDFRDGAYITSYGGPSQFPDAEGPDRISACAAEFLSVHPYFNVVVSFSVIVGGGTLASATDADPCTVVSSTSSVTATTDANGRAATRLTLGSDPRLNMVAATVEGLALVTFTATAAEQATPHRLTKACGDGQEGTAGALLAAPLVVLVVNEDGAAIAGVVVSFSVTAGGGTLSSVTATTDANGRAATRLTLGSDPRLNTVEATVAELDRVVTFTATGQEPPVSLLDLFGGGKLVALPDRPQLAQNAPNPFNSQTVLSYFLPAPGLAHLAVFTLTGQRVTILQQGPQRAGYHRLHWDGRDEAGRPVASGLYLYRLVPDEAVLTRKLLLLR